MSAPARLQRLGLILVVLGLLTLLGGSAAERAAAQDAAAPAAKEAVKEPPKEAVKEPAKAAPNQAAPQAAPQPEPEKRRSYFWWFIESSGLIGLFILGLSIYFVST